MCTARGVDALGTSYCTKQGNLSLSCMLFSSTQLETEREAIPDVPAIYFCRPTAENMRRIAADAGKRLYR